MDRAENKFQSETFDALIKTVSHKKQTKTHLSERTTIFISTISSLFITWTVSVTDSHLNTFIIFVIIHLISKIFWKISPYLLVARGHLHICHTFLGTGNLHGKNGRKILHQTERFFIFIAQNAPKSYLRAPVIGKGILANPIFHTLSL